MPINVRMFNIYEQDKVRADPGIFVRGAGIQARRPENSLDVFFLVFLVQLILQFTEGVQWFYYRENDTFPRIQRCPFFPGCGGSNFFSRRGV